MIYEHRIYDVAYGRMEDLHNRFRTHTLGFFAKHDIKPVAFFTTVVGTLNQLHFILEYRNMSHRETAWGNLTADPDWKQVLKESNANGILIEKMENRFYAPTDYSPLK